VSFRPGPPAGFEPDDDEDTLVMSAPPLFSSPPRPAAPARQAACDEVLELLAVAACEVLPLDLEMHLDGCPRCAARVQEAADLARGVHAAASGYAHAFDFEARVLRAIDAQGAR
jgi:hypothetical protein